MQTCSKLVLPDCVLCLSIQTNEKLVNRIRHVKKILRKYKKLRRYGENTDQIILMVYGLSFLFIFVVY